MKHTQSNEKYKIKVNRVSAENNLLPYSKFLKKDYKKITKISPKNQILYKVKYKPEIIINEYHQTSNNINTNINIKTNKSQNSNSNNSRNNISFNGQLDNFSFNKCSNDDFVYENSIKDENNDKSYNQEKSKKNIDYISSKLNKSDNNESNNNSLIFSPFSNGYSIHSRESDTKRNMKFNTLNKYNKKSPNYNYIFQSPLETKENKNIQVNTDRIIFNHNKNNSTNHFIDIDNSNNYFYGTKLKRNSSQNKKYYNQNINVSNALNYRKYNKRKNPSMNFNNFYNKTNPDGSESSFESFRAKKGNNKMNNIIFSKTSNINNIYKSSKNSNNNIILNSTINYNTNNIDNSKDSLNLKLDNYRTKLFKEFLKHFRKFYKKYTKKNFIYFMKNLKHYKKNINYNKSFIYSKKNYLRYSLTIENNAMNKKHQFPGMTNNRSYGNDLFGAFKSSTMKDYYKLYNQLRKNRNLSQSMNKINKIFNSYSFNHDANSSNNNNSNYLNSNVNRSIIVSSKSKNLLNSAPRIIKNPSNLSFKRNQEKRNRLGQISKSPSFHIGNRIIINNEISFGTDGSKKGNELFRDSKELNRKYEQIQRRKKKSKNKISEIPINKTLSMNKSVDIYKIKNTDEYNQFKELRKYIKSMKKDNSKKSFNGERNKKNKSKNNHLIRISALDDNSNSDENDNNDINNDDYNLVFNKTYYNYHFNMDKFKRINNDIGFNNVKSLEREGRTGMLRKKGGFSLKNKFANSIPNKHNNLINNKVNTNINNSENKSYKKANFNSNKINDVKNYKKVKVNINKKFLAEGQEKNIVKQRKNNKSNIINNNDKIKYNSNIPFIKPNNTKSRLNNSPVNESKMFYTKKNNIKYSNKPVSTLIKDISTRDNRIHININYYDLIRKNKPVRFRYNFLHKSEKISITLLGNMTNKVFPSKSKFILSAIQEEENSIQNSKYYEENETFGNYNNNNHIIINNNNDIRYKNFIDAIHNILVKFFKKKFMINFKVMNKINNIFLDDKYEINLESEKNANNKIYNRKRGVFGNKLIGENTLNESNSKFKRKKYIKRSINWKNFEEKIDKFRYKLIKYTISFSK